MPPSQITTLTPKGKQGQSVTFDEIKADGFVTGTFFAGTDTFLSYSYGLKGKVSDLTIYGTAADEYLVTGDGNDTIDMVGGNNIVVAGGGNDLITTTSGSNYIDGGDGIDTYIMDPGYDGDVDLSTGTATKTALGTSDVLFNIENVFGNNGDNVITGDAGANYLATGGGADTVYGGGGDDQIDAYSQTGSKTFVGGTGNDIIFAGADADEFYWAAGDGADTVYYFDASDGATGDTIHLDLLGDQSGVSVVDLVLNGFLNIVENSGSTTIQIDASGTGNFSDASSITLVGNYSILDLAGNIVDDTLLVA